MKKLLHIMKLYPVGTKLAILDDNNREIFYTVFGYEFTNANSLITTEGLKINCVRLEDKKFLKYKELPRK